MEQPRHIVDGVVPKHEQLRTILTDLAKTLAPGDILPSERQLCLDHGVSRITVREAIGQLVSEGLLVRVRGKGTFVAARAARSRLHLASFTEDMRRMGLEPSTVVLTAERVVPPDRTAQALGLAGGEETYHLRRLRLADGSPLAFDESWYPADLAPGLEEQDLSGSIYRTLADRYGITLDRAEQTVGAVEASHDIAVLLGIAVRRPVLSFDRVCYSGDRAVEHTLSIYRGDRYEIQMSLAGRDDRPGSGPR